MMKISENRININDHKYKKIKKNIQSSRSFNDFKLKTGFNDMKKYINYIFNDNEFSFLNRTTFPKSYRDILIYNYGDENFNFKQELYWNVSTTLCFNKQISEFLRLKNEFENNLLLSKYKYAEEILTLIKTKFGVSIWLLRNTLNLYNLKGGIEAQKQFLKLIINDSKVVPIIKLLANHMSFKAEKNISHERYIYEIENSFSEYDDDYPVMQYLKIKALDYREIKNYGLILKFENQLPVLDMYLIYKDICESILNKNMDKNIDKCTIDCIINSLKTLKNNIDDNEIATLLILFSTKTEDFNYNSPSEKLNKIFNLYTIGNYADSFHRCSEILATSPNTPELFQLFIKICNRIKGSSKCYKLTGKSTILEKILSSLEDVMYKNENYMESYNEIIKLTSMFLDHKWSKYLFYYVKEITSPVGFNEEVHSLSKFIFLDKHNPLISHGIIDPNLNIWFLNKIESLYGKSSVIDIFKGLTDIDSLLGINTPIDKKIVYRATKCYRLGHYEDASLLYNKIINSSDYIIQQEAIINLVKCYIIMNDNKQCMELIVNKYLENKNIISLINLNYIINIMQVNIKNRESIYMPILFEIRSQESTKDTLVEINDACEDFLQSLGFFKPSQLLEVINNIPHNLLIYFLSNVCKQNVLDNSIDYYSTEEIEKERIAICNILREIDVDNKKIYLQEILTITQRLIILRAMKNIDESKIYVDIEGIKNSLDKSLRERFLRFKDYLKNDIDYNGKAYITLESDKINEIEYQIPLNDRTSLFYAMLFDLRDNFVSKNQYGLDGNLSIGIRHGTLVGTIRSTLELHNLVTKKDKTTLVYRDNKYWSDKYFRYDEENVKCILYMLNEFSTEIDELIYILKDQWIQICIENGNYKGLFDFIFEVDELELLKDKIKVDTTYEEFLSILFEELWKKTDRSLAIIRKKIKTELKKLFNDIFLKLQKKLENMREEMDLSELFFKLNEAKTELVYNLDKISNWFKRSKTLESLDFNLEVPVLTAIEMVKNIYPNSFFNPEVNIKNINVLKGQTFKSFYSIFFTLFDNIVEHSKIENRPATVNLEILSSNEININLKSEVFTGDNFEFLKARLEKFKLNINSDLSIDKVGEEGGTGFFKVDKILKYDLKCPYKFRFDYLTDSIFEVSIIIYPKEILK